MKTEQRIDAGQNPAAPILSPVDVATQSADGAPASRVEKPAAAPAQAAPAPAAPVAAASTQKPKGNRGRVLSVLAIAALLGGGWYGYGWWTEGRFMVKTDDAYVGAATSTLATKVSAHVSAVFVTANQAVKKGDLLVQLDNGDYRLAVAAAKAKRATQQAMLDRIDAQTSARTVGLDTLRAQIDAARAELSRADAAFARAQTLATNNAGSQAQLDNATADRDRAKANLAAAAAGLAEAQGEIRTLAAQRVEAVQADAELGLAVEQAERDLTFTEVRAPFDGVIANKSVEVGDYATPGKRLMALVSLVDVHVDANFKETQLGDLAPGERVSLSVDAFPGETIIGTIVSVAPGSGSVFSLLPPDNATGNFTKIVQRVPVRISVPDDIAKRGLLRPGLSVEVAVDTRTRPKS